MLVTDGRVVGVAGPGESIPGSAGAHRVDLRGATLLPGLVDTHPHVLHFGGLTWSLVDLHDARSHADIVARLRERAAITAEGEWILATPVGEPHYFLRRSWRHLAEGALPDRRVLDRATSAHPLFIQAWAPVTPNVCAMNSAALAALGITRDTPDRVSNVWIEKDPTGEPTGILRGSVNNYYTNDSFMDSLSRQMPLFEPAAVIEGTAQAMHAYNRMGVTTVYEGHAMGPLEIEVWRTLDRSASLTLRVLTSLEAESYALPWTKPLSDEEFATNLELALTMTDRTGERCRHDGVTLSRGGPCWPGFLRMREPYLGPYGEKTTGVTFLSGEKEDATIRFCLERGLRLNFIGAGYRDHDEFLERVERAAPSDEIRARRWILQHAYLMSPEHTLRYADLGMLVTTSMSFSWGKGELLRARVGEHVLSDLIPLRRLLDAGLSVACGSDWGPKNVFEHIALAETHEFCASGRHNRGPAQPVTRTEAIRMWTSDAASVLGWEGIGHLARGMHADFIVVDRDVAQCRPEDLPATIVMRTVVGGEVVHDDGFL
jgi:predicted amidohydrolase YtcJ